MGFQLLIPPIIGATIGYVTNEIAIKMLFLPRKPIYIGKYKLPLTPGLIPREKSRVADSIGTVVSNQLLDRDTLKKVLTSDAMTQKLRDGINRIIDSNRNNNDTIEEVLVRFAPKELIDATVTELKNELTGLIHRKLTEYPFGESISKSILTRLKEKINIGTFGLLSGFIDDGLVELVSKNIGEYIDKAIDENSEEIIHSLIYNEIEKIKGYTVSEVLEKYSSKLPVMIDFVISSYTTIIENHLSHILNGIDIAAIIKEKIESFDVIQLEEMIFSVMKKELKAIVRLGALLGFIMGWINLLIKI